MSREGLYKALSEGGNPIFATVMHITRGVGVAVANHGNAVSEAAPASAGTPPPARTHRRSHG